jgi:hypothetical protein
VNPLREGAVGSLTLPPEVKEPFETLLPPFELKVTV